MDISAKKYGETVTAYISGDLDEHTAGKIRDFIDRIIENEKFKSMVIDFSAVEFMDSTGLGMLMGRYKKLKQKGIPLLVCGVSPQIDKVFKISGIYQIVKKVG